MKLHALKYHTDGFSLLEVLVAIAILFIAIVVLMQTQSRSLAMASKARRLIVATQLARGVLADCKQEVMARIGAESNYDKEGKFEEEDIKDYSYQCHAYSLQIPAPNQDQITKGLQAQGGGGDTGSMGASMMAPFFAMISDTLTQSVRELVVLIRWPNGNSMEELKVVTHLVDRSATVRMMQMLPDGGIPGAPGATPPQQPATGAAAKPPGGG